MSQRNNENRRSIRTMRWFQELERWYLQFLLLTTLYVMEPWERCLILMIFLLICLLITYSAFDFLQSMDIDSEPLTNTVTMSNLDEDLMERLRSITTSNREDLIAQFRATTNALLSDEGCRFFLEMNNWNLNEAILAYYDAEMPTDKIPQMRFVADVTVGEGEAIPPNTRFVKTWRVENPSNESWPNHCSLRFVNGDRLQDRDEIFVGSLAPHEQRNISVDLTSPSGTRMIRSQWRLFTPAGLPFGDPIWLVASVEEGGLLGITQQLDQCHSLGMNPQSTMNCSSFSMTGVQPVVTTNPFQSQRWSSNSDPTVATNTGWTNYPLIPVNDFARMTHQPTNEPSGSNTGTIDDNSLDTF